MLRHSFCKNQAERNFYFNRIPRLWNSLSSFDINVPIATIKARLRNFFWIQFISHFQLDNVCSYHLCQLPISMHFTTKMLFMLCPILCIVMAAGLMPSVLRHSCHHLPCYVSHFFLVPPPSYLCCKAQIIIIMSR